MWQSGSSAVLCIQQIFSCFIQNRILNSFTALANGRTFSVGSIVMTDNTGQN